MIMRTLKCTAHYCKDAPLEERRGTCRNCGEENVVEVTVGHTTVMLACEFCGLGHTAVKAKRKARRKASECGIDWSPVT